MEIGLSSERVGHLWLVYDFTYMICSLYFTVQLVSYPFSNGQQLNVIVTEVLSPWEFWIQPVGTQLDLLMEEMW